MKKVIVILVLMAVIATPAISQDGGSLDLGGILTTVFGILMTVFGGAAAWLKRKSAKLANFARESMEATVSANNLVQHHNMAIADGKLTKEELTGYAEKARAVAKETKDVITAFKELFKKAVV